MDRYIVMSANYAPEDCKWCNGTGATNEGKEFCDICNGVGSVLIAQPARKCPTCDGTGQFPHKKEDYCLICNGCGWSHRGKVR